MSESIGGEEGGGGDRPKCPYPPCADPPTFVAAKARFCSKCGGILLFTCRCAEGDGSQHRVSEEPFCGFCGKDWEEEGLQSIRQRQEKKRAAEPVSIRSVASSFTVLSVPPKSESSDDLDDMEFIDGSEATGQASPGQATIAQVKQETPGEVEQRELSEIRMEVDGPELSSEPSSGFGPHVLHATTRGAGGMTDFSSPAEVTSKTLPSLTQPSCGQAEPAGHGDESEAGKGEAVAVEETKVNGRRQTTFPVTAETAGAAGDDAHEAAEAGSAMLGTQDFAQSYPASQEEGDAGQSFFGSTTKPSPTPQRPKEPEPQTTRPGKMSAASFVSQSSYSPAHVTEPVQRPETRSMTAAAQSSSAAGGEPEEKSRSGGGKAKVGGKAKTKAESKADAKKKSETEAKGGGGSKAGGVKVRFVVLMPEDTLLPDEGRVGVVFGNPALGDWKAHRMHPLRTPGERVEVDGIAFYVHVGRVDIPKDLCSKPLEYKYVFEAKGGDETFDGEARFTWEFINIPNIGYIFNRTLRIPESAREAGQFNSMDGFFDVKEHSALEKPGILASLAKKAGSMFLGKEHIKPRFQRALLHNAAAFKFFLPKLDSQGFFLTYDHKSLKRAKTRLDHLEAAKVLQRVGDAFSSKFCKGKALSDLEIFTDRYLEMLAEYKAGMVGMAEEAWVTKILAALVLLSSLASREHFPLRYEGVREEVVELLQLLRIPSDAPPASVAVLKHHLEELDKSCSLCSVDFLGGGIVGLIHTSFERGRATRNSDDDPVLKGLLAAIPIAHLAVPSAQMGPSSSDPKLTSFWALPSLYWNRSGSTIRVIDWAWVARMQQLDPYFARSFLHVMEPVTEHIISSGFYKVAPLDSLAWVARELSKLDAWTSARYYGPWVKGLEGLDEVSGVITEQPGLIGATTPEEAEAIACLWTEGIAKVLNFRGYSHGSLSMSPDGAYNHLTSVVKLLDALASHPTLGAHISASKKLHDCLASFLCSWKQEVYSFDVPLECVVALVDVKVKSPGAVRAVWDEWILQKLKSAPLPMGLNFEKLVREMELLGRVKSAEGELKAALDARTAQLLDSMVASAVDADQLGLVESRMGSHKLRHALSSLVYSHWPPKDTPDREVINFVLSWAPLKPINLFGIEKLAREAQEMVTSGLLLTESLFESLKRGGAPVGDAEWVLTKREVVVHMGMAEESFVAALGGLLGHRASLKDKALVLGNYFPASFALRPAVLTELQAQLALDTAAPLNAFGQLSQRRAEEPWGFQPKLFGMAVELEEPLSQMTALMNNVLFQQCWAEELRASLGLGEETELGQSCEALLRKSVAKAKSLALRFLGGHISAVDAQTLVSRLEQGCPNYLYVRFQEDFAEVGVSLPEWEDRQEVVAKLTERRDQLTGYTRLRRSQQLLRQLSATSQKLRFIKVTKRLAAMLSLIGESGEEPQLAKVELGAMREVEKALASVAGNEDLLRAAVFAYDAAEPLVAWAKSQFAKDGEPLKSTDLDSFKELADSGDDQEKSGLIRDFGSSLEAFGPLVYGLPVDPDFGVFSEVLGRLVGSLEKEPRACEKLVGVSAELDRLVELLDAALSMEKTKVDRVKEIMDTGHFELHCHGGLDLVSPDTLLTLHYQTGGKAKKDASMDLASVKDLHSNLLLIAAQLKEDAEIKNTIDRFSSRMELVLRFLELFLEHWRGGNLFLASVRCRFHLPTGSEITTVMDFQPEGAEDGQRLISRRILLTEMEALCGFLSGSRESWLDFVRDCRLREPALDLFTNRQIVRLRQKLAQHRAGERGRPDLELEMLLSLLKPDVSAQDLNDALREAAKSAARSTTAARPSPSARRMAVLAEVLEMSHFSREDAARALLNCPVGSDAMDLIMWLEEEAEASKGAAQQPGAPMTQMEQIRALVAESAAATEAEQNLDARLARMFQLYLTEQVKDQRLAESIGIGELGRVLGSLWHQPVAKLALPNWLEPNQQNLVVVKEATMLGWTLSVYEGSPGAELSQSDVLVCAATTTEEEVELFVRRMQRASLPDQGRTHRPALYSALFVERLTSQVAQTLHRLVRTFVDAFPRRAQGQSTHFGLVFFCSQEHYETSHLAGLATKFRRSLPEKGKGWPLPLKKCREIVGQRLALTGRLGVESSQAVLVTSVGYGQGKSLAVRRLTDGQGPVKRQERIPIHDRCLDYDQLWNLLYERLDLADPSIWPPIIHLDVSDHRTSGVDSCLFQLLLLGGFATPKGKVWRLRPRHRFVVEMTSASNALLELRRPGEELDEEAREAAEFRFALPLVQSHSPALTLEILQGRLAPNAELVSRGLDRSFEASEDVKRCVRHLGLKGGAGLDGAAKLALLLEKCGRTEGRGGVKAPSWLELTNFVAFLGRQLSACDANSFCISGALPGFTQLVLFFSVEMARDFATRSLKISEEVASLDSESVADHLGQLESYSVKREWERNPHPYLFFNPDLQTFSFFGCIFKGVEAAGKRGWYERVDLVEPKTGAVLQPNVMPPKLFVELREQLRAHRTLASDLSRPFDDMDRSTKLRKLYSVLVPEAERFLDGAAAFPDPDPNYELTMDCALKILAMEMRFRCGIPVVVMGETGCGKTRLLQFYAQAKRLRSPEAQNLLILRVHGGTDAQRIRDEVAKAKALSRHNWTQHRLETILFLDEANTTREMCLVKEVVLERSLLGRPIEAPHLLFAIALNPYKRHSDKAIQRLENAGLGYHVQDLELLHRFDDGAIPMRQLVYRVHPLPPSLVPLAWDFGFLSSDTEDLYIHQMLRRALRTQAAEVDKDEERSLAKLLCDVQHFRKAEEGESSFVSLRDVERALKAFFWFFDMDEVFFEEAEEELERLGPVVRSAILSVGLCYRSSLQERRRDLDKVVRRALGLAKAGLVGLCVDFVAAQFVGDTVKMETRVAKNEALRENVFVMAVTAQLGIPLFLVGKPGSSKSLGKTILAENMKGGRSTPGSVYRHLKDLKFISYQCSPLSTAEGVAEVFRECARQQRRALEEEEEDLDDVGVIPVLDEVGMAEESEKMPLKALHGLLEEGSAGLDGEDVQPWHRTGFVGISNWALDPAKMNRGIFLSRALPDRDQLIDTARCICDPDSASFNKIEKFIKPLTQAYLEVYRAQDEDYEFYGLRDFYSMMKQLAEEGAASSLPTVWPSDIAKIIQHNFSGQRRSPAFDVFARALRGLQLSGGAEVELELTPKTPVLTLIEENLGAKAAKKTSEAQLSLPAAQGRGALETKRQRFNRFLLILTQNTAALRLLQSLPVLENAELIFGSRFPQDLEYTQICRDINRIRLCMEQGRPVILLNLETLYESLYDLLNQSFVKIRGDLVVDIGLGTHRHRTRVHEDFRLVVLAEMDEVRRSFPSALVNRLEKLSVFLYSDMTVAQTRAAEHLSRWTEAVVTPGASEAQRFLPEDVFVGYAAEETPFALVADAADRGEALDEESLRRRLMQICVPEGVLRARESQMAAEDEDPAEWALDAYCAQGSSHVSLRQMLPSWLTKDPLTAPIVQLTTYQSQLLSKEDCAQLAEEHGLRYFETCQLQDFGTEQAFAARLREVFRRAEEERSPSVMVVQCIAAQQHPKLIATCQHRLRQLRDEFQNAPVYVGLCLLLHRLPFLLNDRVAKWASSDVDQFLHVSSQKPLSDGPQLEALADAAGLRSTDDLHFVKDLDQAGRQRSLRAALDRAIARAEDSLQLLVLQFYHRELRKPSKTAGELRAEIGKMLEAKGRAGRRVKVVLVTTVPATSAFPGRGWDSWHLDSLVQDSFALPDLRTLRRTRPSQLLSDSSRLGFPAGDFFQKCIVETVARIKNPREGLSGLAEKMVKGTDGVREEVQRRIAGLLAQSEELMLPGQAEEWVYRVAKNARSLVDSRSFERALLKHLELLVSPLLAGFVCALDAHSNLSLAFSGQPWKSQLWLELFSDPAFVPVRLNGSAFLDQEKVESATTEFVARQEGWEAEFPFSWLVDERMVELVAAERELGSAAPAQRLQCLQARLEASNWGRLVAASTAPMPHKRDAIKGYVHDLVYLRIPTKGLTTFDVESMMESVGRMASEAPYAAVCPVLGVQAAFEDLSDGLKRFQALTRKFPGLAEALGAQKLQSEALDVALTRGVLERLSAPFLTAEELESWKERSPHLGEVESLTRAEEEEDETWLAQRRAAAERWAQRLTAAIAAGLPAILAAADQPQLTATLDALKVARLFLRHTAASPKFFSAAPVFKRLNDADTDVRSAKFLQSLVKMLKLFGDQAFGSCFPQWKMCVECGRKLERREALAVEFLPCRHTIHGQCLRTLLGREGEAFCPAEGCGKRLGADPWEEAGRAKANAVSAYAACREGLRNFFLDLLADSVFSGSQPPPADVIQLLLDLTLPEDDASRPLSPIPELGLPDDAVVLRASILQHLLRYKSHAIIDQLSVYYQRSLGRLRSEADRQRFMNMCVRCVEDAAERELAEGDEAKGLRERWELGLELAADDSADDITRIGRTKTGLSLVARLLPQSPDPASLRDPLGDDEVKLSFLLRCLVHIHGLEKTLNLIRRQDFDWISHALGIDLNARPPLPDVFLCYGDEYKDSRGGFLETLTLRGVEGLGQAKLSLTKSLALTKVAGSDTAKAEWTEALPGLVGFDPPKDEDRQLQQVLGHVAAASKRGLNGLGEVFRAAARDPGSLRNAFLLAMPEDRTAAAVAAVKRMEDGGRVKLHRCPNGHPYIIADCGNAVGRGACETCGVAIGLALEHNYGVLAPGNVAAAAEDQTKRGLCLPLPQALAPVVVSEREGLSPLESTLLRLLQHFSLLLAAKSQPQAVAQLFTVDVPADPEARLKDYVRRELKGIAEKLGRSQDDAFYLLHLLIHRLNTTAGLSNPGIGDLQTKQGRVNYEVRLAMELVRPVLAELDTRLTGLHQLLLQDSFHGDDLLLRLSYTALTGPDSVWTFHRPATLATLSRDLLQQITSLPAERQADLTFLRQLFEQMELLGSLRHLPGIIRLQELLRKHFQRSVGLRELDGLSIADFLLRPGLTDEDRTEIRRLLPAFFGAYKECLAHSGSRGFIFKGEGTDPVLVTLPRLKVDWARLEANPLELLLPIPLRSRPCLIGFGLPRLLARIQNEFLDQQRQLMAVDGAGEALGLSEAQGRDAVLQVEPETRLLPSLLLFRKLEMKAGEEEAEETKFHLAHLQRSLEGGLTGRGRRLRAEWELELSSERLVRSQRRLTEAGQPLSRAEREALVRAFQREDLATLAGALRSLELLSHFLKGGETESLGDLATAFSVPAAEGLGGLVGAQLVDAWTTLKVHQCLLRRRNGSEEHPHVPEALAKAAFSSSEAEAGARAAVDGEVDVGALHRLLSRFILLFAQRLEQRSAEAQTALLRKDLVGWVGTEVDQTEEGLEELAELSDDLLVADLIPLWNLLSEHRLNQPIMQL